MGARDLLDDLAGAGLSVTAEGDRLVIRPASKLTDPMRAALRDAKPELLALLRGPAHAPESASCGTTPHLFAAALPVGRESLDPAAVAWSDADIARFLDRRARLMRWGWAEPQAEKQAERLHLRDLDGDDRRLCLECRHLAGHASIGWRCRSARAAGVAPALPSELVALAQRCPGFVVKVD